MSFILLDIFEIQSITSCFNSKRFSSKPYTAILPKPLLVAPTEHSLEEEGIHFVSYGVKASLCFIITEALIGILFSLIVYNGEKELQAYF